MRRTMGKRAKTAVLTLGSILILILAACGTGRNADIPEADSGSAGDEERTEIRPEPDHAAYAGESYEEAEKDMMPEGTPSSEPEESATPEPKEPEETDRTEEEAVEKSLHLFINENEIDVIWESNASVDALTALAEDAPLTIQMSAYGGFEQVGSIGSRLPSRDVRTTTSAGDIVLYASSQIVIFYGHNTWEYTRLGKAADKTAADMRELLGNGDVTVTISFE